MTRVPFDAEWRRLSELVDPAAYAPQIASRVMWAARAGHAAPAGGRRDRARTEWRARARAELPNRVTQRQLLLQTLAGEGEATQVSPDRFELRLPHDAGDGPALAGGAEALDAVPEVITFVLTPEEWEEVLVDQYQDDLSLYLAEMLAGPDPDERFVVFYEGSLHLSTRAELRR